MPGPRPPGLSNLLNGTQEMYRLMRSEKFTLDHVVSGLMSSHRQTKIGHYERFPAAQAACELANGKGRRRHYVVNDSGQEYDNGTWID